MPSTSPAQARTMAAACHDAAFAKRMGIPQKTACEFNRADQMKHVAQAVSSAEGKLKRRRR